MTRFFNPFFWIGAVIGFVGIGISAGLEWADDVVSGR
jgi:hypothetical protein